jgi:uncharacterized protein YrrD
LAEPELELPGGRAPVLRPFEVVFRYAIGAADGDLGELQDAYFDDASWTVRHFVVDTGRWLPGRRVLLSPHAVTSIDAATERIATTLTRQQIRDAPGVDAARPVSRQKETELARYFGHPYYWTGPYRWGLSPYPYATVSPPPRPSEMAERDAERVDDDAHLRSVREVRGYGLTATDGALGHVVDMLVDEASWALRYFVVDPRSWWPGPHVVIPIDWITDVSWGEQTVRLDVTREAVRNAPQYLAPDEAPPAGHARPYLSRDYEQQLYGHYGRPAYWQRGPKYWLLH